MTTNTHNEHTGVTLRCDRVVTATTDEFEVVLTGWAPYAGAVGCGNLEMDSWLIQMHHDVNLAAAHRRPVWVLDLHRDIDVPGHGSAHMATARRYAGGPLEPWDTDGLLTLDEHGLRPTENGPSWSADSLDGYSDLGHVPDDQWPATPH